VEIEEVEEIIPQIRDHYNISDDTEDEMIVKAYDDGDFDSYEPDHPGFNMDKTWDRHDAARKEKWDINFSPQRTYVQFKDEEALQEDGVSKARSEKHRRDSRHTGNQKNTYNKAVRRQGKSDAQNAKLKWTNPDALDGEENLDEGMPHMTPRQLAKRAVMLPADAAVKKAKSEDIDTLKKMRQAQLKKQGRLKEESKMKIKKSQLVKVIAEEMSKMLAEGVEWIDRSEWKSNQPSGRGDAYEPSDLQLVRDALGPEYYVVDHEDMGEFRNFVQKKGAEGPNGEEVVVLLSTVSSPDAGRTNYFKTAHTDKYGKVIGMEGGLAQPKPAFGGDPEGLAAHWDSNDTLRNL